MDAGDQLVDIGAMISNEDLQHFLTDDPNLFTTYSHHNLNDLWTGKTEAGPGGVPLSQATSGDDLLDELLSNLEAVEKNSTPLSKPDDDGEHSYATANAPAPPHSPSLSSDSGHSSDSRLSPDAVRSGRSLSESSNSNDVLAHASHSILASPNPTPPLPPAPRLFPASSLKLKHGGRTRHNPASLLPFSNKDLPASAHRRKVRLASSVFILIASLKQPYRTASISLWRGLPIVSVAKNRLSLPLPLLFTKQKELAGVRAIKDFALLGFL